MGGKNWYIAEDDDLRTMTPNDFKTKYPHRSWKAIETRRRLLGLNGLSDEDKLVPKTPLCYYCSVGGGDCTCHEGHRCQDPICYYYPRRKRV